jgi:hypothetical protein
MDMQWESTVNTNSPDGSNGKRSARHWMLLLLQIAKELWWKSKTIPIYIHSVREQSYHAYYRIVYRVLCFALLLSAAATIHECTL